MATLAKRYLTIRAHTCALVTQLSDADATVQSMPDASPAKWHLAHTTWFFETFLLDGEPFDPAYNYLFNSYYVGAGDRHARDKRGLLTRPSLKEILSYRTHVDRQIINQMDSLNPELLTLGLHHEQQHQELLLTDILHLFAQNPLQPAACPDGPNAPTETSPKGWQDYLGGKVLIGHAGDDFAFDCETPQHPVWLEPFALSTALVTQGDYQNFIQDGGYTTPTLWLSDGWDWVQQNAMSSPLYQTDTLMTLQGPQPIAPDAPVRHLSFFEADAYARWAGHRLPTEFEWEHAANSKAIPGLFNSLWQWTSSAFLPYPGFTPNPGAVGEYNGKFMNGLRVLRGGSFATPDNHIRATYRNFFAPDKRWQFTGLRLAKDL
jgi:ergothioneine biosynthesis protein EgtB